MGNEYSLTEDLGSLTQEQRNFVITFNEKHAVSKEKEADFVKDWQFIGLKRQGKLIGVVTYKQGKSDCYITGLWGIPSSTFTRTYSVTPAEYLIEELVRRGASNFTGSGFTDIGEKFLQRKIAQNKMRMMAAAELKGRFGITPKAFLPLKGGVNITSEWSKLSAGRKRII